MAGQKRKTPAKKTAATTAARSAKKATKADAKLTASAKKKNAAAEEADEDVDNSTKAKRAATNVERNVRMRKAMQALGRLGEDEDSADDSAADDDNVDDRFVPLTEADRDPDAASDIEENEDDEESDEEGEDEESDTQDANEQADGSEDEDEAEAKERPTKKSKKVTGAAATEKTDAATKKKKKGDTRTSTIRSKEGVVYLGHIPNGFFEDQMKGFFSQFGTVRQLRLSRSKKTGRSRGYAFIQFESNEVAKIVQKAMHNYLLCDKLLVCELVKPEDVHERMFANANRRFRNVNWARVDAKRLNKPRTAEEAEKRLEKLKSRRAKQQKRREALGIDYELPGYA